MINHEEERHNGTCVDRTTATDMTPLTEQKYHTAAELVRSYCRSRTCTIHIYTTPGDGFPQAVHAGVRDGAGHADGSNGDPATAGSAAEHTASATQVTPILHPVSGDQLGHIHVTGRDGNGVAGTPLTSEVAGHLIDHIAISIAHDRPLLHARRTAEDARLRLREANHRMKNVLQTVESLLSLQAATQPEGPAQAVLREATQRVRTVQILYNRLSGADGPDDSALSLDVYLNAIVESLAEVYRLDPPVRWSVNVAAITMSADHLSSVGLILNEVVSNALIHGFTSHSPDPPAVEISATRRESDLQLRVSDNGVGIPQGFEPGESAGLGTTIVQLLTERLGGTLTYENRGGTTVTVSIPLGAMTPENT